MHTQSYAETINTLIALHLVKGESESIEALVAALGCRHSNRTDDAFCVPEQPSPLDEPVVQAALQHSVRWHSAEGGHSVDGIALVDGLIKNGRWRQCLASTDDAIALTILLMDFAIIEDYDRYLHAALKPGACAILNEWLSPSNPITEPLQPAALARLFFGDAWCDISFHAGEAECQIGTYVSQSRPPFLPGILGRQLYDYPEQLPELGNP